MPIKHHLRIYAIIAAAILLSCQKTVLDDRPVTASSWQGALPDDMPVRVVSLPGAHDAATSSITTPLVQSFAKTQVMPVGQLWEYGVRVFDLRPAVVDGGLLICHSSIRTKTTFADAVGSIVKSIDANPTEFAIIIIRHEEEADGDSDKWGGKMAGYINSLPGNRIVKDFDPDMTVGQIRGRILFLFREDIADPAIGARIRDWTSSDDIAKQKSAQIGDGTLWVQDYYDPEGADDKMACIKALMDEFAKNTKPGIWCINHTSGYNPAIFGAPDYGSNAENVNTAIAGYIDHLDGSAGMVLMDFAGAKRYKSYDVGGDVLLQAVINHNPLRTKVAFSAGFSSSL